MVLRVFTPDQIAALPDLERGLIKTKEHFLHEGIKVQTELQLGSPAEKIIEMAESNRSSLIVVGARGLRSTLGILLGGVAQQVVEYAHGAVLVVRAPYQGMGRILLVTDGSVYSHQAARYLCTFPLPEKADVRVMHVMPPLQPLIYVEPYLAGWRSVSVPLLEGEERVAQENAQRRRGDGILKRTCDLLGRHGVKASPVLGSGDAATEIMKYVNTNEVDLIVAGSRGLSRFQGWWMGSVSRKLVHYSNCSVLIVKGPKKE